MPSPSPSGQPCKATFPATSGHLSLASKTPSPSRSRTTGGATTGTSITFFFSP